MSKPTNELDCLFSEWLKALESKFLIIWGKFLPHINSTLNLVENIDRLKLISNIPVHQNDTWIASNDTWHRIKTSPEIASKRHLTSLQNGTWHRIKNGTWLRIKNGTWHFRENTAFSKHFFGTSKTYGIFCNDKDDIGQFYASKTSADILAIKNNTGYFSSTFGFFEAFDIGFWLFRDFFDIGFFGSLIKNCSGYCFHIKNAMGNFYTSKTPGTLI